MRFTLFSALLTGVGALALSATSAQAQESFFTVSRFDDRLAEQRSVDGSSFNSSRVLTIGGTPIARGWGLDRNPVDSSLIALVQLADDTQRLVRVDPNTGDCTALSASLPEPMVDLAISPNGGIYLVSGDITGVVSSNPGRLYRALSNSSFVQSLVNLTNAPGDVNAHAIAWNDDTGELLHNAGGVPGAGGVWEYVEVDSATLSSPLVPGAGNFGHSSVTGLTYAGGGSFWMRGAGGSLCTVDASTGFTTFVGFVSDISEGLVRGNNDFCGNATPISVGTYMGSLEGAPNETAADSDGNATCGVSSASPDVWYSFRAGNDGTLRVTTCGTNDLPGQDLGVDTVLSLHSGCPGDTMSELVCNDDNAGMECSGVDLGNNRDSAVALGMLAGEEVLIRVSNFNNSAVGEFVLNVSYDRVNTDCAAAVTIGEGQIAGSLVGATRDTGTTDCFDVLGGSDNWYRFNAPEAGILTVNTCGTHDLPGIDQGMDTTLSLFDDCAGTQLACVDDGGSCGLGNQYDSQVMTPVQAGDSILIRVANLNSASSNAPYLLNVDFVRDNDTCDTAAPLAPGNYMLSLAGSSPTMDLSCTNGEGDLWFELTAPGNGRFEIDTCGSQAANGMDTILGLYDSCADVTATGQLDCNDDDFSLDCGGIRDSFVSAEVTTGQTILLMATEFDSALTQTGEFLLNVRFVPRFQDFCNGDGGVSPGCTDCPCGNNATPGTIGGCLNSNGNSAQLVGSGEPAVASDTMRFEMFGGNPMTFAILSSGPTRAPANASNPCFGLDTGVQSPVFNGLRCVVSGGMGPVQRHGTRATDASGNVGVANNGWGFGSGPVGGLIAQGGFVAGQTRHYQVIYREEPFGTCLTTQNTSQGVTVTFTGSGPSPKK